MSSQYLYNRRYNSNFSPHILILLRYKVASHGKINLNDSGMIYKTDRITAPLFLNIVLNKQDSGVISFVCVFIFVCFCMEIEMKYKN